jgi:hypothetical protein
MATSLGILTTDDRVPRSEAALLAGLGVLAGVAIGWAFAAPALEIDVITLAPPASGCGCSS